MHIADFQKEARQQLEEAGIGTARLDVLVLLEDCLGRDRALLLAHPEIELTAEQIRVLNEQISRRASHVPLAYIRGKTEFYGRMFIVNDHVLEPRPESETIIDLVKSLPKDKPLTFIDIGTGSGALAITAKLEVPGSDVLAIDIDTNCLDLARKNAETLKADITFMHGDLLEPIKDNPPGYYALLCNLPYVPDGFHINQAASHEPRLAIFGGPDGLDVYRTMFRQIDRLHSKPAYIITEAIPPQHEGLAEIAKRHGYAQKRREDFIQIFAPAATSAA